MKTISQYPGLIGQILRRSEARKARRTWWRRLIGLEYTPKTHVARISPTETIYSER